MSRASKLQEHAQLLEYYKVVREWADEYHNHKEVMAHAILLVQVTLAGAVVTNKLSEIHIFGDIGSILVKCGVICLSFILHFGICANIYNKKIGAKLHIVSMFALRILTPPYLKLNDLEFPSVSSYIMERRSWFLTILNAGWAYMFPIGVDRLVNSDTAHRVTGGSVSAAAFKLANDRKHWTPTPDGCVVVMSLGALIVSVCGVLAPEGPQRCSSAASVQQLDRPANPPSTAHIEGGTAAYYSISIGCDGT